MRIHDVGMVSVYYSVWTVIDVINMETSFKREVPSHEKQKEIAEGFGAMSGAGFKM